MRGNAPHESPQRTSCRKKRKQGKSSHDERRGGQPGQPHAFAIGESDTHSENEFDDDRIRPKGDGGRQPIDKASDKHQTDQKEGSRSNSEAARGGDGDCEHHIEQHLIIESPPLADDRFDYSVQPGNRNEEKGAEDRSNGVGFLECGRCEGDRDVDDGDDPVKRHNADQAVLKKRPLSRRLSEQMLARIDDHESGNHKKQINPGITDHQIRQAGRLRDITRHVELEMAENDRDRGHRTENLQRIKPAFAAGGLAHDTTFIGFTVSLSRWSPIALAMKRAVIGVLS